MIDKRFISYTVNNDLCMGCGVCEDVCPTSALKMVQKKGILIPDINYDTCINEKGCTTCFKVCAGHGIEINKIESQLRKDLILKHDKYMGNYLSCFTGYSTNHDIRYHASSGGMITQFLIYLLERGVINGAVITGFDSNNKTTPQPFIATTKEEILTSRSSKYCPVSLNQMGNEIKKLEGKYIVVGLPCHIHSFRKREAFDKKLRERVLGYFSIFCSGNRSYMGTEYLFKDYNIDPSTVEYFAYRDEGCLGSMKIIDKSGNNKTIPYLEYYPKLRSYFKPNRCLTCSDHYGVLADINFGDIHIGKYIEDKIGINSIIVRNPFFQELLIEAQKDQAVHLDPIEAHLINESQKTMLYPKKRKIKLIMDINRLVGRKSPVYDSEFNEKYNIKDILSYFFLQFQRMIGSNRKLWFLIKLIGIKKVNEANFSQ